MTTLHPAEERLAALGITAPKEIDIEAIAYDFGVEVRYDTLTGCEATLVGYGDMAIATIQQHSLRQRQRFSVGHELGHWHHHRGESFRCRVDELSENLAARDALKEQQADSYSAHLLMPGPLFKPLVKEAKNVSFGDLREIAMHFDTSVLASALRLIDVNTMPAILTCYDGRGLRWFRFSMDVPRRWYLRDTLDEDSFAYDLLIKGKTQSAHRKSSAETWFTNDDAVDYELLEHSTLGRQGEVLTLLIPGAGMLEARFDPDAFPKRYTADGSYTPKRRSNR